MRHGSTALSVAPSKTFWRGERADVALANCVDYLPFCYAYLLHETPIVNEVSSAATGPDK